MTINRCKYLYNGGLCWLSGYAGHMCSELSNDLVVVSSTGTPIKLGGGIEAAHKDMYNVVITFKMRLNDNVLFPLERIVTAM